MTTVDLSAIESRLRAAHGGTWTADGRRVIAGSATLDDGSVYTFAVAECEAEADAVFIANARQDVATLVAEVHRMREALAETRISGSKH